MHEITQELRNHSATSNTGSSGCKSPPKKKHKRFGQQFESGNMSDEYDDNEQEELDRYLTLRLDMERIEDNPMLFWKEHVKAFPILAPLACRLHSIPATTASVERSFSGGGRLVTERRSNLSPSQVDNILFLRSAFLHADLFE
jgi:hypothetical protein